VDTKTFNDILRAKIRKMTRDTGLYVVLRDELTALGYWHKLPRGNPKLGYEGMCAVKGKVNKPI